jgi:hypothetical protein
MYRVVDRVGSVGLRIGGDERWFSLDRIAIISFVEGDPGAAEVRQLPDSDGLPVAERHRFVTRDGAITSATLDYINPTGQEVTYDGPMGRRMVASSQLQRIYLNPRAARSLYSGLLGEGQSAAGGSFQGVDRTVNVPGNQPWIDTGLTVRRGDRIAFRATGEIRLARPNQPELVASPDGATGVLAESVTGPRRRVSSVPVPGMQVGGLIARIGSSDPFPIGLQNEPITMGQSGRLMLGVNAASFEDNRGAFTVDIARR